MSRNGLSKPMQQAFADGLLDDATVFDYGCGRGDDLRTLTALGIDAAGWDPAHSPTQRAPSRRSGQPRLRRERHRGLRRATRCFEVSMGTHDLGADCVRSPGVGPGLLERQAVRRRPAHSQWHVPEVLQPRRTEGVGEATLGIQRSQRHPGSFTSSANPAFGTAAARPSLTRDESASPRGIAELLHEQHRSLLAPLETFVDVHRKLPSPTDLDNATELVDIFGSIRGGFNILRQATGTQRWSDVDLGTARGALSASRNTSRTSSH
jgi:hypothetical protein